ncbi:sensor histidine kinase [Flavobacteriaceae bacterium R38]|nr:sensor histidine kinase [Flavobacteriaceae bacterium R38]
MISFIKKYRHIIISVILILISFYGMAVFKGLSEQSSSDIPEIYFGVFQTLFLLTLGYIILSWLFNLWKQYRQLKNDKNEAELALLKSKIDPHFFFNTLNNLYGLAIKKSDDAPKAILKLSEIMRYTIYEGENETVAIKDEANYLEQYIEIHQLRYKKKVSILFEKNIDDESIKIAPLLFIMLLENAFKHGVESLTDNAYVKINLMVKNSIVTFLVKNNYESKEKSGKNIGLENLKRRLQLIYPKHHKLIITPEASVYKVKLTIRLK